MKDLTKGSPSKVMISFAIPVALGNIFQLCYSLADTRVVGSTLGEAALAAVGATTSISTLFIGFLSGLTNGFALLIARQFGAGDKKGVTRYGAGCLLLGCITSVLLTFICVSSLPFILRLLNVPEALMGQSTAYIRAVLLGLLATMLYNGCASILRAVGDTTAPLLFLLFAAALNVALDLLFILKFGFGVAGAAWATIIGQIISALMVIRYLTHFKTVKLTLKELKPRGYACGRIISLGMSPFLNQLAIMIVQVVMNNVLVFYGSQSVYGGEIPLACAGIISKVNMIFFSISIGLSQGMQPIASFNYGAENYDRVREAVLKTLTASTLICTLAFLLFQLFPRQITGIFGSGSEEYFTFASRYFRIFLFFTFLNGIQPVAGNFFTAIGKPVYGIFISLTRQIIFLLPLILILPRFFGIDGVLYSAPIADFLAACLALFLTLRQLKKLSQ